MDKAGKRFLVHIELTGYAASRLMAVAPKLQAAIEGMSNKNCVFAYRSAARDTLGYFLRSELAAAQIRSRLKDTGYGGYAKEGEAPKEPILSAQDRVLVVEIGSEYDIREFNAKIDPWLRNH